MGMEFLTQLDRWIPRDPGAQLDPWIPCSYCFLAHRHRRPQCLSITGRYVGIVFLLSYRLIGYPAATGS